MKATAKERLEARVSREQKALLQEAAALRGQSLTDFVLTSAQDAARRTVEESHVMTLSRRDRDILVRELLAPAAPNRRLRAAAKRYRARTAR